MPFDESAIKSLIPAVPNFPKPGVVFRDITPLFQSPQALHMVVGMLLQRYLATEVTHVAALDARGFLLGPLLAYELNKPLVVLRKKGKLPPEVLSEVYATEYGEAVLEVHKDTLCDGDSVVLVDDLIATGGTLLAAAKLVRRMGARVLEAASIVDLAELGGSRRLAEMGIPTFSLVNFDLDER